MQPATLLAQIARALSAARAAWQGVQASALEEPCGCVTSGGPVSWLARGVRRMKQVVELVYDTIREPTRIVSVPMALARLLAMPRERLFRTVRAPACLAARAVSPPVTMCLLDHSVPLE